MYRFYRKMTIMVIFLYNLYIFVWIQNCLPYTVFALAPSNSVMKLW